jgi:hypothetical protein
MGTARLNSASAIIVVMLNFEFGATLLLVAQVIAEYENNVIAEEKSRRGADQFIPRAKTREFGEACPGPQSKGAACTNVRAEAVTA